MKLVVGISSLLLVSFSASATADRFDGARAAIRQHMLEANVPGVSVAVAQRGKILWEEGFGWADKENRVAATEHTMYSLASLTKPITATAVMTLVQAGKIDLDRPINDYLGDAKLKAWIGNEREVTVRRVIDHTSGLASGSQFFYGDERSLKPSMDLTILRYGHLVAPAGERYDYSNLGYGVLDYVVERVSGQSFPQYMRASVFAPLGMTHSSVDIGPGLEKHQAIRYDRMSQPIPFYATAEPGAAAMYSSAHDLIRFGMFFLKHRSPDQRPILSDASIDQMMRAPADLRAVEAQGGAPGNVGWQVRRNGNYAVFGHAGSMAGVTTELSMIPAQDISVVVLSNASMGSKLYKIRDEVLKPVLPDWQPTPANKTAPPVVFQPTPDLIGTWEGAIQTYERELPVRMTILATGDVHLQVGTQLATLLDKVEFKDGRLTGSTLAQIDTSDTKRHPHTVTLSLKLRGDVLNGQASANSVPDPRWTWIYGLPHWIELKKAGSTT
jgi:CubicO group peptidase (beta-lactamase class C family)